jgi:pimeloyl-ACP methyl ester carboxylesterase
MTVFQSPSIVSSATPHAAKIIIAAILSCLILLMPELAYSQDKDKTEYEILPAEAPNPPIITKDGLALSATYYPSSRKKEASVVVLLHGLTGNHLDWGKLPERLQKEGYAVLAVDLRGHGQSNRKPAGLGNDAVEPKAKTKPKSKTKPSKASLEATSLKARDFAWMVEFDMTAVKDFLFEENQKEHLNMNKTAIIGAGLGAAVALKFAEIDWKMEPYDDGPVGNQTPRGQDIRALVLLTPDADVPGMPLTEAIKYLREPELKIAMMFGFGNKDKKDKGHTKKLFEQATTPDKNKDRMYLQPYNSAGRGCGLLERNSPVEQHIVNFLKSHLNSVESEWRDRESRVGRKAVK